MAKSFKVLSTKKLEPSLVETAKQSRIEIIEKEFISITPIRNKETFERITQLIQKGINTIVLTSSNAIEVLESYIKNDVIDWKIFCLSGKTKEAVANTEILGADIIGEAKNATELAKEIIRQGVKEVIFFSGNKRRNELPAILKDADVTVNEVVVYETVETPVIVSEDVDGILFFSPSAVQSFFSVNQLKGDTVCFAIGETTANSIADFTGNKIVVSEAPSQEMMLMSVRFYFENSSCYE